MQAIVSLNRIEHVLPSKFFQERLPAAHTRLRGRFQDRVRMPMSFHRRIASDGWLRQVRPTCPLICCGPTRISNDPSVVEPLTADEIPPVLTALNRATSLWPQTLVLHLVACKTQFRGRDRIFLFRDQMWLFVLCWLVFFNRH